MILPCGMNVDGETIFFKTFSDSNSRQTIVANPLSLQVSPATLLAFFSQNPLATPGAPDSHFGNRWFTRNFNYSSSPGFINSISLDASAYFYLFSYHFCFPPIRRISLRSQVTERENDNNKKAISKDVPFIFSTLSCATRRMHAWKRPTRRGVGINEILITCTDQKYNFAWISYLAGPLSSYAITYSCRTRKAGVFPR